MISVRYPFLRSALILAVLSTPALAQQAPLPPTAPNIPPAETSMIPTLNYAVAAPGWPNGRMPVAASGLSVTAFASELKHPRWLLTLPNGDVLVAEAASLPKASWAPKAIVSNFAQRRAGGIVESANQITLLRDTNGDGTVETRTLFLDGLRQPFGMAVVGSHFYVANTDSVVRYDYTTGQQKISSQGTKLIDLPVGHHWTRNLIVSPDQSKLFVTVGSGSNIGENGLEAEVGRATILEHTIASGKTRVFASGLRNANGMAFEPSTGELWAVVNERDEIGDDTPPDYLTSVKDGGFYGWPYSYWGKIVDTRVTPARPELVASAIVPDYSLGGHTAPLGLATATAAASKLPEALRSGMFVGLHGSWNRTKLSGYKVVFVPFRDGRPSAPTQDVLTGFVSEGSDQKAFGRPVGVAIDASGALLVADDVGNTVWRVTARPEQAAR